jgi:hypothetical protein
MEFCIQKALSQCNGDLQDTCIQLGKAAKIVVQTAIWTPIGVLRL